MLHRAPLLTATSMTLAFLDQSVNHGRLRSHRRWLVLFCVATVLQVFAVVNSDLGLDAHVRLNAVSESSGDEHRLAWGPMRVGDSNDQAPSAETAYDGYIPPWNTSEAAMKTTALTALLVVAFLACLGPRDEHGSFTMTPIHGFIVMVSPVFLFATGRGYDESVLALLGGIAVVGFLPNSPASSARLRLHVVFMATSLLFIAGWKGFALLTSLGLWVSAIVAGFSWVAWHDVRARQHPTPLTAHPWLMGFGASMVTLGTLLLVSLMATSGTFAVVSERPGSFLVAFLFAVFDAAVLYLLVGFALWPLAGESMAALGKVRSPELSLLTMYIAAFLTAIAFYIAALWTLESALWNRPLSETMVVLGNNGRYATCLILPLLAVLKWPTEQRLVPTRWPKKMSLALTLLLPFVLFTAFVGQQIWSEDAGQAAADAWAADDEVFLLIADDTLAMHHLYVLKTHLDLDGSRDIQGYWRSDTTAESFLETTAPDLVLLGPGTNFLLDAERYVRVLEQEVPITISGGIQEGSWELYRAVE